MSNFVEYIIGLKDQFSAAAEKISAESSKAKAAINAMGQSANAAESKIGKLGASMTAMGKGQEAITRGNIKAGESFTKMAQSAVKAESDIMAFRAKAQASYDNKFANNPRYKPGGDRYIPPGGIGGAAGAAGGGFPKGLGTGIGLYTLASVGDNDVYKDWMNFDEQMRLVRGTMAGQATEQQLATLRTDAMKISKNSVFSPEDIAKIFVDQASSGIDVTDMGRIAKQMVGLSTGTGEDPGETFKTHLAIQRGFELPLSSFPHISDTIARVHQKTGIQMNQIMTQMAQISAFAHTAGWTEEQTVGTVGYLAKRGMGNFAGSGIARLISKSASWSKPAAEFWGALGIRKKDMVDKETGGVLNPGDMVELLRDRTMNLPKHQVAEAFTKMFGDRGQKVAAALANADPAELRAMIEDLKSVNGLAERMGEEGTKGGAAGVKRFTAALKRMNTEIGEAGYGDTALAGMDKIREFMDWMSARTEKGSRGMGTTVGAQKHPALLQAMGWLAMAGEMLSKMAMPLLAASILWPILAAGIGKVVGLGAGIAMFGARLVAFGARATGIATLASSLMRVATAGRLLMGLTGIGAALLIGAEIYANWDKLANAAHRAWEALKGIAAGNFKPAADLTKDTMKWLDSFGAMKGGDAADAKTKPKMFSKGTMAQPPMMSRPSAAAPSAGATAGAARGAAQERIKVETNVRTTMDPIVIKDATLNVKVTGQINGQVTGNGSTPLSATAPRGQSTVQDAAPRVSK